MTDIADVVVVGSGPAGISCCWPLVTAGLRVRLVDPGQPPMESDRNPINLHDARTGHPASARLLLGADLRALRPASHSSPKLRLAVPPAFTSSYLAAHRIETTNFMLAGSLFPGGLSNIWGAVASAFDTEDLVGLSVSKEELAPSYRSVAARIGISGTVDDDLGAFHGDVPLQPPLLPGRLATALLNHRQRRGTDRSGFKLGLSRNAVLSKDMRARSACSLDALCMWGCSRGAIYNSARELDDLKSFANFSYSPGCLVRRIDKRDELFRVTGENPDSGVRVAHHGRKVVLAAGTVVSTQLVSPLLGLNGKPIRLLNNPGYTFALLLPRFLGRALEQRDFAMAQLSYTMPLGTAGDYTTGLLYSATGIAAADMAEQMPLTMRGGLALRRALSPALMLGLGYFDGKYSDNSMTVDSSKEAPRITIRGGWTTELPELFRRTHRALFRAFARIGAIVLPGSCRLLLPGGDSHYAGTLGMGRHLNSACEVNGLPGLHVVDGAAFGRLPAKHLTFNIMANADRVGRLLASSSSMRS